jgi:hypothetical protein
MHGNIFQIKVPRLQYMLSYCLRFATFLRGHSLHIYIFYVDTKVANYDHLFIHHTIRF